MPRRCYASVGYLVQLSGMYFVELPPAIIAAGTPAGGASWSQTAPEFLHRLRGPKSVWQTHPVTWVPQIHHDQVNPQVSLSDFSATVANQLEIANYSRRHTNHVVVHQGVAAWLKNSQGTISVELPVGQQHDLFSPAEFLHLAQNLRTSQIEARGLFPQGLPHEISQLTMPQQKFLARHGAAHTLLYLGELPQIGPTTTPALERKVAKIVVALAEATARGEGDALWNSPEIQRVIMTEREEMLGQMLRKIQVATGKPLLCIYGGHHAPPAEILVSVPDQFVPYLSDRAAAGVAQQRTHAIARNWTVVGSFLVFFAALAIYWELAGRNLDRGRR